MTRQTLINLINTLFSILFVYAAVSKVMDFELFKSQIGKSPLIMYYTDLIAVAIPVSEILITIMLLVPRLTLLGLYGCFALMTAFTAYITFVLTLSPYVPCSCGGILNKMGWTEHLVFNIFFMLLSVMGIMLQVRQTTNTLASIQHV